MSSALLLGSNMPTNRSGESINPTHKSNRSWIHRTFSKMEDGSLRGNILLLIITTMGSSFFYLPYCAKRVGIMSTIIMLGISAFVSFYSSMLLFHGFSNTSAKTYDECFEKILGQKIGLFANLVVLLHTFGAVISTWIFSFRFITSGILDITHETEKASWFGAYKIGFFCVTFIIIYLVTLGRSIERLKMISMIGLLILIYLISCLVYMTPDYFDYYLSLKQIHFKNFIWTWEMLKVYGMTQYMFLNQYSIMTICNNLKEVSFKRTTKLVKRSIVTLFIIYVFVLFCGYFSQPDIPTNEIFLLRTPIPDYNDIPVLVGKMGFGLTLLIGILVKSYYLLMYFEQFLHNSYRIMTGDSKRMKLIQKNIDFVQQHKNVIKSIGDRHKIQEIVEDQHNLEEQEKRLEEDLQSKLIRTRRFQESRRRRG